MWSALRLSLGSTPGKEESYRRWNIDFYPWNRIPVPPPGIELYLNCLEDPDQNDFDFCSILGSQRRPFELRPTAYDIEQFTLVFMTYSRHSIVRDAIAMFRGVRQLRSVVVIWNDLEHEPWMFDLGLDGVLGDESDGVPPVRLIRPERNSLNNRLLPYEAIDTECVMQIDDDTR